MSPVKNIIIPVMIWMILGIILVFIVIYLTGIFDEIHSIYAFTNSSSICLEQ